MLEKNEFIKTYNNISNNYYLNFIDDLYLFECLTCSGFDNSQAYDLMSTLRHLWLKDENCRCISGLSDMLYEYCTNHDEDVREIPTRKLLVELYKECDY